MTRKDRKAYRVKLKSIDYQCDRDIFHLQNAQRPITLRIMRMFPPAGALIGLLYTVECAHKKKSHVLVCSFCVTPTAQSPAGRNRPIHSVSLAVYTAQCWWWWWWWL